MVDQVVFMPVSVTFLPALDATLIIGHGPKLKTNSYITYVTFNKMFKVG